MTLDTVYPGVIIRTMRKKAGKNRKKRIAAKKMPVVPTGLTRRDVIVAGVTSVDNHLTIRTEGGQ